MHFPAHESRFLSLFEKKNRFKWKLCAMIVNDSSENDLRKF